MYIPGRRRTCSTPSRTVMSADVYWLGSAAVATPPPRSPGPQEAKALFAKGLEHAGKTALKVYHGTPPSGRSLTCPKPLRYKGFEPSWPSGRTTTRTPLTASSPRAILARLQTSSASTVTCVPHGPPDPQTV